jgi:hypothetical protein
MGRYLWSSAEGSEDEAAVDERQVRTLTLPRIDYRF